MATLRGILTYFGFKADGTQLAAINASVAATKTQLVDAAKAAETFRDRMGASFGGVKSMIMGIAAGAGLKSFTLDFAADAEKIRKSSEALGIGAESYQVWSAAARSAGVDTDQFNTILGKIGKNASEAARGQGEAADTFRRLGVDVKGADGKVASMEVLLGRVSDAFAKLPAGPQRTAYALKLFEEQGTKLLPFLTKGSKGVEELRRRMLKAGIIIGDKSLQDAKKFTEAQKAMQGAMLGVRNTIGAAVLPYMVKAVTAVQKWITQSVGLKRIMAGLEAGAKILAIALGGILLSKILAAVIAFTRLGAAAMWANIKLMLIPLAFLAIALAIEDLYRFFRGEDSLIGRILGPDASKKLWDFMDQVNNVALFLKDVALEKVKTFGRGAAAAIGWTVDKAVKLAASMGDLWEFISKPPGEEEGWLGFLHGLLNGIYQMFKKAFEAGQKLAELMGLTTPETAVGLTTGARTDIDDAVATGIYNANENQRTLRDLGLPEGEATVRGSYVLGEAQGIMDRMMSSPFDFGAVSSLADLQRNTGMGSDENRLKANTTSIVLNMPVTTEADPNEIGRVVAQEIDRRVRTAYDDYLEASGVTP
jgi:hypothetical protein